MARNPQTRAASRAADATRKRAKRALARVEKQLDTLSPHSSKLRRSSLEAQRSELQSQISGSYATRERGNKWSYTKAAQNTLAQIRQSKYKTSDELKTVDFSQELNKAAAGRASALGDNGQIKAKVFWRATQSLWEGHSLSERQSLILQGTNSTSLQQAYAKIMRLPEVRDALKEGEMDFEEMLDTETEEGAEFLRSEAEAQREYRTGSPIETLMLSAYTAARKAW